MIPTLILVLGALLLIVAVALLWLTGSHSGGGSSQGSSLPTPPRPHNNAQEPEKGESPTEAAAEDSSLAGGGQTEPSSSRSLWGIASEIPTVNSAEPTRAAGSRSRSGEDLRFAAEISEESASSHSGGAPGVSEGRGIPHEHEAELSGSSDSGDTKDSPESKSASVPHGAEESFKREEESAGFSAEKSYFGASPAPSSEAAGQRESHEPVSRNVRPETPAQNEHVEPKRHAEPAVASEPAAETAQAAEKTNDTAPSAVADSAGHTEENPAQPAGTDSHESHSAEDSLLKNEDEQPFSWLTAGTHTSRRARRNWATKSGWQFDKDDPELAPAWAEHIGETSSRAKDVLSGRIRGYRAHVADIDGASFLALARTGSSDSLVDFRPAGASESGKPPRRGQQFVSECGHFNVYSKDPLSAGLMLDIRSERALTGLSGAASALVIDPWWILIRSSSRPHVSQLNYVFNHMADLADAARVLPAITTEYLDMEDGDPTRAYGIDIFQVGAGPRLSAVDSDQAVVGGKKQPETANTSENNTPETQADTSTTSAENWSKRPDVQREPVDLPRRDRGMSAQSLGEAETYGDIGENTGEVPIVGEDPEHTAAQFRPGQVIRVEADYTSSTIFGQQTTPGRHRKPNPAHRQEETHNPHTTADEDEILHGELEPLEQKDED